jgi:hypothetical protein
MCIVVLPIDTADKGVIPRAEWKPYVIVFGSAHDGK